MLTEQDNSLRKAAVFVQSLDEEAAETLFARLSYDESARLRAAVQHLGDVHEEEQEELVNEFRYQKAVTVTLQDSSIVDDRGGVALEIGSEAYNTPTTAVRTIEDLSEEPADWFACLSDAEPIAIAGYLAAEQPRAIALVLSHVSPDVAASILSQYDEQKQSNILLQMASLGEADPTSVRVLATGLSSWIKRQQKEDEVRINRISSVNAILAAVPSSERDSLVERLQESNSELSSQFNFPAEEELTDEAEPTTEEEPSVTFEPSVNQEQPVKSPQEPETIATVEKEPIEAATTLPFVHPLQKTAAVRPLPLLSYADLERIDAPTLSKAIGSLTPRQALLALVEADEPLLKRIESRLPRRSRQELRKRINKIGPTLLSEIDQAKLEFIYAAETIVRKRRTATLSQNR